MQKRYGFTAYLVLATLLLLQNNASAQISLTSDDVLGLIGSRQVVLEDMSPSIPIDVGSPGANQVWDFRTQDIGDSLFSASDFMTPDQANLGNTFPDANWVQRTTTPDEPGLELFSVANITPSSFIDLGDSTIVMSPGFDTTLVHHRNNIEAPLPIQFNDTWMTTDTDTSGFYPATANIIIDTTLNTVDAWGTVMLPMGNFECLRLKQEVKIVSQTIFNGVVFSTHVDSFLQYDWVANDVFLVASAQSQSGDMNPSFTTAQAFSRLDSLSFATSVQNHAATDITPSGFELVQNYPNPFNPSTTVQFNLPRQSKVTLSIYNVNGQLVRTLAHGVFSAGSHNVVWDGRDEQARQVPSGMYVARMQAGEFVQHNKMLLIK